MGYSIVLALVRTGRHKCEIDDAKGGPLPPDISFDNDVIGDENIDEEGDEEDTTCNEVILAPAPPVEAAPVAHGNGVLALLPQNISDITASHKRAAFKNKGDDILEVYKLKVMKMKKSTLGMNLR